MVKSAFMTEKNKTPEKIDIPFVLLVILLCGIGLTTLYSGSSGYADRIFGDPLYFVKRQLINLLIGIVALLVFSAVNLEGVRKILPKIIVVTIIISLLPFIPGVGVNKNGATRWIGIGSSTFQPSELIKMMVVFYLANIFAKKHDRLEEPGVSVYPAAIMSLFFVGIVYLQNDFSTALFVLLITLIMFYIAGVRTSWFIKFLFVLLPLVFIMVVSKEYRIERVLSYLHPEHDPLGAGYQVNAAMEALSGGGFWGLGLGNGIKKISSIPEVQSDFIFAVWGEEMGFFGVLVYFLLLIVFSLRGFFISIKCTDRFRSFLGFGCTSIILLQSLMNCGVVIRFFPATGVPLPFFSSGGSSLLITLCLCGLIINVSRWEPEGEIQNV